MPGEYSDHEVAQMTPEDLYAAATRNWSKPVSDPADLPVPVPETGRVEKVRVNAPHPSGNVWAAKKAAADVFVCPSGQTCRLREVTPDQLLVAGILDRVTRLEGLAAKLVHDAEGNPPELESAPTRDDWAQLLSAINIIVPLAVLEPKVYPDPTGEEEPIEGRLYASDIDLEDRMAIMEAALKGIRALDRFRKP